MIPAGSVIRTESDVRAFRLIDKKEEKYQADVFAAANGLREGYVALYGERISKKVPG
jgi:hypothetical protein